MKLKGVKKVVSVVRKGTQLIFRATLVVLDTVHSSGHVGETSCRCMASSIRLEYRGKKLRLDTELRPGIFSWNYVMGD